MSLNIIYNSLSTFPLTCFTLTELRSVWSHAVVWLRQPIYKVFFSKSSILTERGDTMHAINYTKSG